MLTQASHLRQYVHLFANLRSDTNRIQYPADTLHRAPHKPLLLLAVLDLFAQGAVHDNRVPIAPELGELLTLYWRRVMPPNRRPNLALPFFHLKNDGGFWQLTPTAGNREALERVSQIRTINRLQELVASAELSPELARHLSYRDDREVLRSVLITRYFSQDAQGQLIEQGEVNAEAFEYSRLLLGQHDAEQVDQEERYRTTARRQGFRRAIVIAYDHRCAMCGIRVLTGDGHTAVEAAQIKPWTESRNDHPTNGMALCRLCHWCFDEGLLGVDQHGAILVSRQLANFPNVPAHLSTLDRRPILGPEDAQLAPALPALVWHQRHVFRAR